MNKIIIFFIVFICLLSSVYSNDNVISIKKCYGEVDVKVRANIPVTNKYYLENCEYNKTERRDEYWKCFCVGNKFDLNLIYIGKDNTSFDVTVQYYLNKERDLSGERITNINNIKRFNIEEEIKTNNKFLSEVFNSLLFITIIILFIVFLIISIGCYFLIKMFLDDPENQIDKPKNVDKNIKDECNKILDELF